MNKTYGLLTVIKKANTSNSGHLRYHCVCECGRDTITTKSKLLSGHTKSCGCLRKNFLADDIRELKYGKELIERYHGIKTRCYNKKCQSYKDYGGRGVVMCDEWLNDVRQFYWWSIENGFSPTLTIERLDTDGIYSPENCKWIPKSLQARNRRNTILYKGKTCSEWAKERGIKKGTISRRIRKMGWDVEKAIFTPLLR